MTCAAKTSELRRELASARLETDSLFRLISPDALYERPVAERHRLIFYLGHLEAFDWNLLARRGLNEPAFHPAFDSLFERGIDPAPGEAPADTPLDWPSQAEVESYKLACRAKLDVLAEEADPALLQMAVEHRHMHAETLAYLLHRLPYHLKHANDAVLSPARPAPENRLVRVPAGIAALGTNGGEFGWDNERAAHETAVPGFGVSRFKISNGEYLTFVREGGPLPPFWTQRDDVWFYRGMFRLVPLPLDQPAWVTWEQASAYAKWRGLALPSEAQFHRAASLTQPDAARDNFDYRRWDPVAVDAGIEGQPADAPLQMTGNGWEWTRDVFAPFDGFAPHPAYPGYSADFFDGQHYVLKGASPRTAARLTRPGFRNWFRPDYPYMYAGFRLVEN